MQLTAFRYSKFIRILRSKKSLHSFIPRHILETAKKKISCDSYLWPIYRTIPFILCAKLKIWSPSQPENEMFVWLRGCCFFPIFFFIFFVFCCWYFVRKFLMEISHKESGKNINLSVKRPRDDGRTMGRAIGALEGVQQTSEAFFQFQKCFRLSLKIFSIYRNC